MVRGMRTILVADENPGDRALLTWLLRARGYDVIACADGREALASALERRPDVALLETVLPYRSGFEVLSAMRRHRRLRRTAVFLATSLAHAAGGDEDAWRARTNADGVLFKPYGIDDLVARFEARA